MYQEHLFEGKIMGSDLFVSLVAETGTDVETLYQALYELAALYNQRFSRFLRDSELTQLNTQQTMAVSPAFMEIFHIGKKLYRDTARVFNPLVSIARFGYDEDIEKVCGQSRAASATGLYNIDMDTVSVTNDTVSLQAGQAIDVGGYLKGFVAEKMAQQAQPFTRGGIINLGGDMFTWGVDVDGKPFLFEIEHPINGRESILFTYGGGGVATSGAYRRYWTFDGKPFHHILDTSGMKNPETDMLSATVLAPRGHEADAYATTALILGSNAAAPLLSAKGFDYCFILRDGSYQYSDSFAALARS